MHLGAVFGIVGIIVAALCVHAQSGYAQQKPDAGGLQSAPPAAKEKEEKKTKQEKKDEERKDQEKKDQPKKDADKGGSPPTWLDYVKEVLKGIEGILGRLWGWALIVLIALLLFRRQIGALLDRVIQAIGDQAVTLEAGTVKIQVSERAQDLLYSERGTRFSVSPFELDSDPYEGFADTGEVPPQFTFPVSDEGGKEWKNLHPAPAQAAQADFDALKTKVENTSQSKNVMPGLVAFARSLEKARFVDATRLKKLLEANTYLLDAVLKLAESKPTAPDEQAVAHAAGVAYAQASEWPMARRLLEPVAWPKDVPVYLPAADVWLSALYHERIEKARGAGGKGASEAFLNAVRSSADEVASKAEKVVQEMEKPAFLTAYKDNAGYYQREVNKVLGIVLAIRAEFTDEAQRRPILQRAVDAYSKCTGNIAGEGPSPLDHNNMADAYRAFGRLDKAYYAKAHAELEQALSKSPDDQTFLNTKALILVAEKKLDEAVRVLLSGPTARMAEDTQELEQYVDNQLLAAKIASGTDRPRVVRLSEASYILERAAGFLNTNAARLDDKARANLEAQLNELLGFTYLGLAGYERRSVECFERIAALWESVSATAEIRWRRRLGTTRAYTRFARMSRRDFDHGTARNQRTQGRKVLRDTLAELDLFGLGAEQPQAMRLRNARVQLDTAMALQGVAEESFHGGELGDAKELLDRKDGIVAKLPDFAGDKDVGATLRLARAHTGLLRGLLAFHGDPGTYEPAVLTEIEKNLLTARGQDPVLDCQVDLALGGAFLAAALAGKKADALANHRKAVDAFELAVAREAPALRTEATRALLDAYARRPAVQRRAKESKGS